MWSATEKLDDDGRQVGIILHNIANVSTYVYDSEKVSLTIMRDKTVFSGMNAVNFLQALFSAALGDTFSDPEWTTRLRKYILIEKGKLGNK